MLVIKARSVEFPLLEQMEGEKLDGRTKIEKLIKKQGGSIESEEDDKSENRERLVLEAVEGSEDGDERERSVFYSETPNESNGIERSGLAADISTDGFLSYSTTISSLDLIKFSEDDLRLRCLGSRKDLPDTLHVLGVGDTEREKISDLTLTSSQQCRSTNDIVSVDNSHQSPGDCGISNNPLQPSGDCGATNIPIDSPKDCSIAIAPKERQKLFEKFYCKARRFNKVKSMNRMRLDVQHRDFLSITRFSFKRITSRNRSDKGRDSKCLVALTSRDRVGFACIWQTVYLRDCVLNLQFPHQHSHANSPTVHSSVRSCQIAENSPSVKTFVFSDLELPQPLELLHDVYPKTNQLENCLPEQEPHLGSSNQDQVHDGTTHQKPRQARWKPPSSWGVMYNRSDCELSDNFSQKSESTIESLTKSSEVSECSELQIVYDDPALDFIPEDHHNYHLSTPYIPLTFTALRVYYKNLARLIVHCSEQTTTAEFVKSISERLGISPKRKNKLFISILGVERMMSDNERPFLLQKRLMGMYGYASVDRTNILASVDHSFYYYFAYCSEFDRNSANPPYSPKQLELNSGNFSLVGMNLASIPLVLYKHAASIVSMQLCSNPNISNVPVNFARSLISLVSISITRNHLVKFPSSLVLLKSLKELDLSHNLIGSINDVDFFKLKNLTSINLSANHIREIPAVISKHCPNLEHANFSNNFISTIPPSFFLNARKLQRFDLSWNLISCSIPSELQHACSLKYLNLSHNSIFGCFPDVVSNLHELIELDLSDNMIGGPEDSKSVDNINKALSLLLNLEYLRLDYNQININSQCVDLVKKNREQANDEKFTTFSINNLKFLSFSYQELPSDTRGLLLFDPCLTLTSLDLRYSGINTLPRSFFYSLLALEKLDLSGNNLSTLPGFTNTDASHKSTKDSGSHCYSVALKLRELYISHNNLEALPNDICSLSNLTTLELQNNKIRILPYDIWMCTSLRMINLTSNCLRKFTHNPYHKISYSSGSVDPQYGQRFRSSAASRRFFQNSNVSSQNDDENNGRQRDLGSSLQYLYLSNNMLDNDISYILFRLNNLVVLHCAINEINDISHWFAKNHGNSSNSVPWYSKLRELYLGCNLISVLPCEIEVMKSLKWLFLNGNRLKTIPGELGKLKKLEVLDVSNQYSSDYESTKLHYNVTNWPYEWNWNWNLDLKYLNLSGNKRLEIKETNRGRIDQLYPGSARALGHSGIVSALLLNSKSSSTSAANRNPLLSNASQVSFVVPNSKGRLQNDNRNLVNFNALINLRFLGLIDVTCHNPPPDETHRRRIRATNSEISLDGASGSCVVKYAIADVLARQMNPEFVRVGGMWLPQPPYSVDEHSGEADFEIWDLVIPRFRNRRDEALFAVFEGRGTSKGARVAKYIYDNFSEIFASELENVSAQSRKFPSSTEAPSVAVSSPRKTSEPIARISNIPLKTRRHTKDITSPLNISEKNGIFNVRGSAEHTPKLAFLEAHSAEERNAGHRGGKCSSDKVFVSKARGSSTKILCTTCKVDEMLHREVHSTNDLEKTDKMPRGNARSNPSVNDNILCNGATNICTKCNSFVQSKDSDSHLSSYDVEIALHRTFLRINRQIVVEQGNLHYQDITPAENSEIHSKQTPSKRQTSKSVPFNNGKLSALSTVGPEQSPNMPDTEASGTTSQKQSGDTSTPGNSASMDNNNIHNMMFGVSAIVLFFCSTSSKDGSTNCYRLFTANVGDSVAIVSRHGGRSEILSELHTLVPPSLNDRRTGALSSYSSSIDDHSFDDGAYLSTSARSETLSNKNPGWISSEIHRVRSAGGMLTDKCKIDGNLEVTRSFGYYPLLGIINSNPSITETVIRFEISSVHDLPAPNSLNTDHYESGESSSNILGTQKQCSRDESACGTADEFIAISSSSIFKAFCRNGSKRDGARRLISVARSAIIPHISSRRIFNKAFKGFDDSTDYSGSSYYSYVSKQINSCYKDWSISAMKVRDTAIGLAGCDNTRAGLVMILGLKDISLNHISRIRLPARSPSLNSDYPLPQGIVYNDMYDKFLNENQTGERLLSNLVTGSMYMNHTPESNITASINTGPYRPIVSPPQGQVALVFTDIKNSTKMWEDCPSEMRTAIKLHHAVIRNILLETGGYEVKTEGDSFMTSFSSVTSAVEMCSRVQEELLVLDWPREIVYFGCNKGGLYYNDVTKNYYTGEFIDTFESVYNAIVKIAEKKNFIDEKLAIHGFKVKCSDEGDAPKRFIRRVDDIQFNLLFRGLSVRMGVHWGSPLCEMDSVTFRMDYYGSMVNRAARVAGLANGGQILLSYDSTKNLYDTLGIADPNLSSVSGFHISPSRKSVNPLAATTEFSPLLPPSDPGASVSEEARRLAGLDLHHRRIGFYKLKGLETPEVLFELYHRLLKNRSTYFEREARGDLYIISKDSTHADTVNAPNKSPQDSKDNYNIQPDVILSLYHDMSNLLNKELNKELDTPTIQG